MPDSLYGRSASAEGTSSSGKAGREEEEVDALRLKEQLEWMELSCGTRFW